MKGPEFFIESLSEQMESAIHDMNHATDLDERLKHSQIVQNLTASWGSVMSVVQNAMLDEGMLGDYFDEEFDDEEELDGKGIPF